MDIKSIVSQEARARGDLKDDLYAVTDAAHAKEIMKSVERLAELSFQRGIATAELEAQGKKSSFKKFFRR